MGTGSCSKLPDWRGAPAVLMARDCNRSSHGLGSPTHHWVIRQDASLSPAPFLGLPEWILPPGSRNSFLNDGGKLARPSRYALDPFGRHPSVSTYGYSDICRL
jgi:hypothetical protein